VIPVTGGDSEVSGSTLPIESQAIGENAHEKPPSIAEDVRKGEGMAIDPPQTQRHRRKAKRSP
jgi:hypothetical protein